MKVNWLGDRFLLGFSPLFYIQELYAFFHNSGNFFSFNDFSNIIFKGTAIDSPQILIIFIDIMSQPWALDGFKVFMISSISFLVTWNEVILAFVLCKNGGKILVFCIGVHTDEKKY